MSPVPQLRGVSSIWATVAGERSVCSASWRAEHSMPAREAMKRAQLLYPKLSLADPVGCSRPRSLRMATIARLNATPTWPVGSRGVVESSFLLHRRSRWITGALLRRHWAATQVFRSMGARHPGLSATSAAVDRRRGQGRARRRGCNAAAPSAPDGPLGTHQHHARNHGEGGDRGRPPERRTEGAG